jgi:hypothetical protein
MTRRNFLSTAIAALVGSKLPLRSWFKPKPREIEVSLRLSDPKLASYYSPEFKAMLRRNLDGFHATRVRDGQVLGVGQQHRHQAGERGAAVSNVKLPFGSPYHNVLLEPSIPTRARCKEAKSWGTPVS